MFFLSFFLLDEVGLDKRGGRGVGGMSDPRTEKGKFGTF